MLTIKNIKIWYKADKNIIKEASLSISENTVVGLLGFNGAGKSTLINTISDVHEKYTATAISFRGESVAFSDEAFKLERYTVFTDEQAFMYWRCEDYISFIAKAYKRKLDQDYLNYLINGFNFGKFKNYEIKDLSTGNKKKVFLITGFSLGLPLLILDEPLDGLDFSSSEFLYEAITGYKKYGSILMSSHIAESFEKTCDYVLLLNGGVIDSRNIERGIDIRTQLEGWLNE
ncbi:ATP-binding cassette domain-containing protein [Enterococcus nangangensis]|uniref:ATP-binding cassette domain-containing protein n=1 Tax=Enterococcus nangangensis TaxID=2559926 RepID=UPI0010F92B42|nr:ATP-binding cassette domain-containing protein [Enterococcus nangangensis]